MSTLPNLTVGRGRTVHAATATGTVLCGMDSPRWHQRERHATSEPVTCRRCQRIPSAPATTDAPAGGAR